MPYMIAVSLEMSDEPFFGSTFSCFIFRFYVFIEWTADL